MKYTLSLLVLFFATACAIAPMGPSHTGKTNGAGVGNFNIGLIGSAFYTQAGLGIHDNIDLGFVFEFGGYTTSGITAKYSFLNNTTGPAAALEASYGGSDKSEYHYFGGILSYQMGEALEVFVNGRYNTVQVNGDEYEKGDEIGLVEIKDDDFNYFYLAYGINIWPVPDVGLNIYSASVLGNEIKEKSNSVGVSLLFKL